MATEKEERKRLGIEVGDVEAHGREMVVRRTQRNIKMALTERWYAWEDAWKLAEQDEEVDLEAEPGTTAYRPVMHEVRFGWKTSLISTYFLAGRF